jgi:hypothetical protein
MHLGKNENFFNLIEDYLQKPLATTTVKGETLKGVLPCFIGENYRYFKRVILRGTYLDNISRSIYKYIRDESNWCTLCALMAMSQ